MPRPKVIYKTIMINNGDDKKLVYFATIHGILIMSITLNVQLSKYIRQLKKKIPSNEWKIVRKVFCNVKSSYYESGLKEKYFIINYLHEEILLNKRSELIT